MDLAISMASKSIGQTGINPVVGCVIVKDGRIVGLGAHLKRGENHAEVNAVRMAGHECEGATAYVTLEPCSHYGKTPPCSDLLIEKKVVRVVVATLDPNPLVAGRGIAKLRQAGIEVTVGVKQQEAILLNEVFNKYIVKKMPYVVMKSASTLDGKLATETGSSQWISGAQAREEVHTMRHRYASIMVGVNTILQDDPSLTSRLSVETLQPRPIIVDSTLRIPLTSKIISERASECIIFTSEHADLYKKEQLEQLGATVITCGQCNKVDLQEAMKWLGENEICSVLLEGGGKLNGAMLEQRLIDKIILYYGMKIVGGKDAPSLFDMPGIQLMSDAITLQQVKVDMIGNDIRIVGYPSYDGSKE